MQRGRPRIWKLCYFGLLKAFKKNESTEKHIFQELYRGKRSESLGFATQKGEEVGVGAAGL